MTLGTTKYYLVSYSHSRGLGNIFYKAKPYLDVRLAEKQISEASNKDKIVILNIVRIKKKQFKEVKQDDERAV